jgi:hypothetical protein
MKKFLYFSQMTQFHCRSLITDLVGIKKILPNVCICTKFHQFLRNNSFSAIEDEKFDTTKY